MSLFATRFSALLAVAFAALAAGGCGRAAAPAPSGTPSTVPAATVYTCSMHPQIRQPAPGRCPLCGMDLIPASAGASKSAGRILELSETARALASVETAPVRRGAAPAELRFLGRFIPDPTRVQWVTMLTEGRIATQIVNYCCAPVKRGQPLLGVYSPDVLAASRELITAVSSGGASSDLAAAAREKLSLLGVGDADIDRALADRRPLTTFAVTSPVDGTATEIMTQQGQWVMRGMAVVRIDDLSKLWLELDVTEGDIASVRVGQEVDIAVEALPGRTFHGVVNYPQRTIDAAARVLKVRVETSNPDGALMPGMFARATVLVPAPSPAPLTIPATAPLLTGRRAVVYVADPAKTGTYEGREIEIGPRRGDAYEVVSGLQEGEQVVIRGAFQIDSALQIEARPGMMASTGEVSVGSAPAPSAAQPAGAWREGYGAVVELYLALQAHLAGDRFDEARGTAEALPDATALVRSADLPSPLAPVWAKSAPAILEAAGSAGAKVDASALRIRFEHITTALLPFVRAAKSPPGGTLVRIHCPMAFDGRGADWLQRDGKVANPYFGGKMPECGEIVERF